MSGNYASSTHLAPMTSYTTMGVQHPTYTGSTSAPYSTFVHEPATQYVQQPMQTVQYIEQPVKYEYVQQPVQYVQPVQSEPRVQVVTVTCLLLSASL